MLNSRVKIVLYGIILPALSWRLMAVSCWAQEEFKYDSKGKRNPFIPLVTPDGKLINLDSEETKNNGFMLEGIIFDKNGVSYAIVNGSVVKVGDIVGQAQVLKIEKNSVIFVKDGQTSQVSLKEED